MYTLPILFMLKSEPLVTTRNNALASEFMKTIIQSLKGTRDFYPEEMAIRTWLYNTIRKVSESFGYQEYEGPFLEPLELYAAKSGDELVNEQSYVFPDRGGDMITLRPELTPTLVRMIAQRQRQLPFPLRWWSFGPFWRYERPQKGRTREFFQWNIDIIGITGSEADAELVAVMATFFRETGLTPDEVKILVNNRRLMEEELGALGIPDEKRLDVFHLIDRQDKMAPAEWEAYAREIGLGEVQLQGVRSILNNGQLWRKSQDLSRFFPTIEALGVGEYVEFAPHIIRGLDYYTGTVYEAQSQTGGLRRAILGGGRYDHLLSDVGGEPLPAAGFAMGDVVITLLLQELGHLPAGSGASPAPVLVTVFNEQHLLESYSLSAQLRSAGLKVACYPEPARLSRQFKYADRMGMQVAAVLGPDELAQGLVTLKDLKTGAQKTVSRQLAAAVVREMLDSHQPS